MKAGQLKQQRIRLKTKLVALEKRRQSLLKQLGLSQMANYTNARQSDRKFRENNAKALSARRKRLDKSMLLGIDKQIAITKRKLNDIYSIERANSVNKKFNEQANKLRPDLNNDVNTLLNQLDK